MTRFRESYIHPEMTGNDGSWERTGGAATWFAAGGYAQSGGQG
jgi:hypothetical protein